MGLFDRLFGRGEPAADRLARASALAAKGDHAAAIAIWEPLARRGDARARNALGACHAEGLGVPRDLALAQRWIGLAAAAGDRVAQRNLAALVFRDDDDAEAARLYRIAAENGDAPAQDMLSWMLLDGIGVAVDPEAARAFAERAAAGGIASAMTRLGTLHGTGNGTPRDPEKSVMFWRRAADRGDAEAQALLGAALIAGLGLPRDPVEGLAWLLRAERGGSLRASAALPSARDGVDGASMAEAERRAALPLDKAVVRSHS